MIKRGIALVFSLIAIAVLTVLGVASISRSVSERYLAQRSVESNQAFWLAEAGVEDGRLQLSQDWDNRSSSGDTLGAGSYNFTIYDTDGGGNPLPSTQLRIVSTGSVGDVSRPVEIIVDAFAEAYQYAVFGVTLVELKEGVTIHGDLYVDGDVEVQAGASIVKEDDSVSPADPNAYNADVYYTGAILGVEGTVEGDLISTTEVVSPPTFDWDELKADADFPMDDGTTLSGTLTDGVYYITGDVKIEDVTLNQGAIISEGKIEVSGNFTLGSPEAGFPALANQTGTMELDGTAEVSGLVYSGGEGIELKTEATMTVYGSIIAANEDVELKTDDGELHIYHESENLSGLPSGGSLEISSWNEQQNPYQLVP